MREARWKTTVLCLLLGWGGVTAAAAQGAPPAASAPGRSPEPGRAAVPRAFDGKEPPAPAEVEEADPFGYDMDEATMEALRRNPPLHPTAALVATEDKAAGGGPAPSAPSTTVSLQGIGATGWIPPDNGVAAGPSHVGEAVNEHWRIYTKSGTPVTSLVPFCGTNGWWTGTLPAGVTSCFDPKFLYDHQSGRWILVALAINPTTQKSWYLVATSWTSDPTGTWCTWSLDATLDGSTPTGNWADYPGLGVDGQAIYITSNQFPFGTGPVYAKLRILNKSQLYGNTCGSIGWTDFWNLQEPTGGSAFSVQPTQTFDAAAPEYLVSSYTGSGSSITLWKVTNPLGTPSLTAASVATQPYSLAPTAEQCTNTTRINTGDARLLNAVYRSGLVVTAHTSACPSDTSKSCVHAVAINPAGPTATFDTFYGAWTTGWYYYYPAVMTDQSGNLHLVFNRSQANAGTAAGCVELRQTGKLAAETQLQASAGLHAGAAGYVSLDSSSRNRWGDYSGIAADPQDGGAVWMSGEYVSGSNAWSTWIGQTKFMTGPPVCRTLTHSHTGSGSDPVAAPANSSGCPSGQYTIGEVISLTASPAAGWSVGGWSGTDNDASLATTNSLVMPDSNTTVSVLYKTDVVLANGTGYSDSLTNGSSQAGWSYYTMTLPVGSTNLAVDLYNLSNDVDLYVRQGAKPTLSLYDCRPYLGGTDSEQCVFATPASGQWWIGVNNYATGTISYTVRATWSSSGLDFYTVTPCRVLDTRSGSPLLSQVAQTFSVAGSCGIPPTAKAVSFNVAVTAPTAGGYVTLWPAGLTQPLVSAINFAAGQTLSNNAVVPLALSGGLAAQALVGGAGTVQLILDANGYFQ